jgi:hypothetical protein
VSEPRRGRGLGDLWQAFDQARFGAGRTLNLRASLPTADEAALRTERWLRDQQVAAAGEVLVITGRGNQSEGGVSRVREAVIRVLHTLRRRGVVSGHQEHTAGSFVVTLAPMSALIEAPRRRREPPPPRPPAPAALDALSEETRALLRNLAERVLDGLGVQDREPFMAGEMLRQFGVLAASVPPVASAAEREAALRRAIRQTLDDYE